MMKGLSLELMTVGASNLFVFKQILYMQGSVAMLLLPRIKYW